MAPPALPALYAMLFEQGKTWTLPVAEYDGDAKPKQGTLACKVAEVTVVADVRLAKVACTLAIGSDKQDWGWQFPGGVYTADATGLGWIGGFWPDDELALRIKGGAPGKPLIGAKPKAFRKVTHEPVGDQTTTNVETLRAVGSAWCYSEAGDFDSNEYTVCIDKTGLVGARFQKVLADGHFEVGKVPVALKLH